MLFDAIIRSLEVVSDVIEFGPVKAAQINTSFIPEAERATARILSNLEKDNYGSTRPHTNTPIIKEKMSKDELVLDQMEEDMINKAVSEKGAY